MTARKNEWGFLTCWVGLLFLLVLVVVSAPAAVAGEKGKPWSVTLDATYATQYMWRGYDVYKGDGAFQPSIDVSLYGFGLNVWGSFSTHSGHEDLDEIDYTAYWGKHFLENRWYGFDLSVNYIYYDFPKADSTVADTQEVGAKITFPDMVAWGPFSLGPSYYLGYLWKAHSGGPEGGYYHIFGLDADLALPALLPGMDSQHVGFHWEVVYADGPFGVDTGFTHATVGVSTVFEFAGLYLSPSVNYQFSFKDAVDDQNEVWCTVGLGFTF